MKKPILSPIFTIEGIHKLREYNYEMTKHMTDKGRMDYYNNRGREAQRKLERMKAAKVRGFRNSMQRKSKKEQDIVDFS